MEELVDVIDFETGCLTGDVVTKRVAHSEGIWHRAVHILIISKDKRKILLQKRCNDKKLFPNMWDISVGGHVSSSENSLVSAKREVNEELGLNSNRYEFNYVKEIKEKFLYNDIDSREFVDIYMINDDINISDIILQKDEVSDVRWFTKKEFNDLIYKNKIIDHKEEYLLINEIMED